MKKLFLSLVFLLAGSVSFASNETINTETKSQKTEQITAEFEKTVDSVLENGLLVHTCTYRMYSNGQYLGNWTITGVPDNVACGSSTATHYAIESYNGYHEMFP